RADSAHARKAVRRRSGTIREMNPPVNSRFLPGRTPGRRRLVTPRLLVALAGGLLAASHLTSSAQVSRAANSGAAPAAPAAPAASSSPVASAGAAALSDTERCLLERLRTADPRATVA